MGGEQVSIHTLRNICFTRVVFIVLAAVLKEDFIESKCESTEKEGDHA